MSTNPKREYLGLELGKIGDLLPENYRFDSPYTMNRIIEVVEKDIIQNEKTKKDNPKIKRLITAVTDVKEHMKNIPNYNFYENLDKICIKIPFDDAYAGKPRGFGDLPYQIYNLTPTFTTTKPKSTTTKQKSAQYIIGRINSIQNFGGYTLKPFKSLYLEGATFQWTPFVNDLFITCSYAYAKFLQIKNQGKGKNLVFPIMLVMAKNCVEGITKDCNDNHNNNNDNNNNNNCSRDPKFFSQSTITTEELKGMIHNLKTVGNQDPQRSCVYQPISDNKDPTVFPSITFRELVILADIFGMNVYRLESPDNYGLKSDEFYVYYFLLQEDDTPAFQTLIKGFNDSNIDQGFSLVKTQVKWARPNKSKQKGGYYNKYMEYKQKYLVLKKIKKE